MTVDRSRLELAVAQLVEDVRDGTAAMISEASAEIRVELATRISSKLRYDPELVDDAVDDALIRFERFVLQHDVAERGALGLLRTMADRAAIDRWRRFVRDGEFLNEDDVIDAGRIHAPGAEDIVLDMIDQEATTAAVMRGLRRAMELGRSDVVQVVRTWLDLADAARGHPSQREVADALGISHSTVRRALSDFAELVESEA